MREICTSGSVGAPGEQSPGATRPNFHQLPPTSMTPTSTNFPVDTENQAIPRIDARSGVVSTVAGCGPKKRGYGGDGGPASGARLNRPHGICVGPGGVLYIGDSENHRVRRIRP